MIATASSVLEAAAQLVERGWSRRELARAGRRPCAITDPAADHFCVYGALCRALEDARARHLYASSLTALRDAAGVTYLPEWNDAPRRTKAEVVSTLRLAALEVGWRV